MRHRLAIQLFFAILIAQHQAYAIAGEASGEFFSIVVLPDTQCYLANVAPGTPQPQIFTQQTEWIARQKNALNVVFVLHVGDVTQNNTPHEWEHARASMSVLDGSIPYAIVAGNHDIDGNCKLGTRDSRFSDYFPPGRFANLQESYPAEPERSENTCHFFSSGGADWLILALEFGPRDTVLQWANDVARRHPQRRVIVLTHTYLYWNGKHQKAADASSIGGKYRQLQELPGGANDGIQVWEQFVSQHPNLSFVFSGHVIDSLQSFTSGDNARLISTGRHGNKVIQVLTNFQSLHLPPPDGTYRGPRSFTGGGGLSAHRFVLSQTQQSCLQDLFALLRRLFDGRQERVHA